MMTVGEFKNDNFVARIERTHNKGLNEIYFFGADIGNQTFVHLFYNCGLRKCCASNPPKNKLHKSPNRYLQC